MNFNEQQRNTSELDSRRVSTGVLCIVVRDGLSSDAAPFKGLLALLNEQGHWPQQLPRGRGINYQTGVSNSSDQKGGCIAFVVPYSAAELVIGQLKTYNRRSKETELPTKGTKEQADDYRTTQKALQAELMRVIQDQVFLVTVANKLDGQMLNGEIHDVFVHTREQATPRAEAVVKDYVPREDSVMTSESWVEAQKEGNERYREIVKNLNERLKKEAESGRSSARE